METRTYTWAFRDIDRTMLPLVGGKGANLGELARIEGIRVPDGFCVSTEAFTRVFGEAMRLDGWPDRLHLLKVEDREEIRGLCGEIRRAIEEADIPEEISEAIGRQISRLGAEDAYAVRSSATAEDSPTASFAGQHDTFLNVIGQADILGHIRKCWASLFSERAVIYRMRNGFDPAKVGLAVVVQKMAFPEAAGILFTADPVTGNRKTSTMDAGFGLGEALVSGLVDADTYQARDGRISDKRISTKKVAIQVREGEGGGTRQREIEPGRQTGQVLPDEEILRLEEIGRRIEKHFGRPQDIEWCWGKEGFQIVQSRPITTLFPVPESDDQGNHVYVSVGHQQMMTDPMKPLGLSFFLLTTRAPMRKAGGRLFVDVTPMLASPATRKMILDSLGKSDPLIKDALETILEREDFIPKPPDAGSLPGPAGSGKGHAHLGSNILVGNDPEIVAGLVRRSQASLEELERTLRTKSGTDVFDAILADLQELKRILTDPQSLGIIISTMDAAIWINDRIQEWLGEKNAADILSQSVPGNVTSEMGLALMEVADAIRPHPAAAEYLRQAKDAGFLEGWENLEGGREARSALEAFLDRYGMRCAGEIDISRARWSEQPTALVPLILSHLRTFAPGAGGRKFAQGRQEALEKEREILERLRRLPEGDGKAEAVKRRIDLIRTNAGYREYPKYAMVSRYFAYKRALLKEAEGLVRIGALREREDIHYLTFEELREAVGTGKVDYRIVGDRKDEHRAFERLSPPRVITSEGEIFAGRYRREDLPAGALPGLPVSSGVIEGRARVILRMEDADLEEGDILVTAFTDPSWTPLFVAIRGLVTEVGGLMTHGAVIAREYGLPAVVGVENATRLIGDGRRIRVHGADGYVELL